MDTEWCGVLAEIKKGYSEVLKAKGWGSMKPGPGKKEL